MRIPLDVFGRLLVAKLRLFTQIIPLLGLNGCRDQAKDRTSVTVTGALIQVSFMPHLLGNVFYRSCGAIGLEFLHASQIVGRKFSSFIASPVISQFVECSNYAGCQMYKTRTNFHRIGQEIHMCEVWQEASLEQGCRGGKKTNANTND